MKLFEATLAVYLVVRMVDKGILEIHYFFQTNANLYPNRDPNQGIRGSWGKRGAKVARGQSVHWWPTNRRRADLDKNTF